LKRFLDFIQFKPEVTDVEKRCIDFPEPGKQNPNWALNHFIRFLQYQKERVEKGEIAASTLRNFVKSLKAFFRHKINAARIEASRNSIK
jgi:hypothetical protein